MSGKYPATTRSHGQGRVHALFFTQQELELDKMDLLKRNNVQTLSKSTDINKKAPCIPMLQICSCSTEIKITYLSLKYKTIQDNIMYHLCSSPFKKTPSSNISTSKDIFNHLCCTTSIYILINPDSQIIILVVPVVFLIEPIEQIIYPVDWVSLVSL